MEAILTREKQWMERIVRYEVLSRPKRMLSVAQGVLLRGLLALVFDVAVHNGI